MRPSPSTRLRAACLWAWPRSPCRHQHQSARPRLDTGLLLSPDAIGAMRHNLRARRLSHSDIDDAAAIFAKLRSVETATLSLRQQRNKTRSALTNTALDGDSKTTLLSQARLYNEQLAHSDEEAKTLKKQLDDALFRLPNSLHGDTPIGDEDAYQILSHNNPKPMFDFAPLDHLTIGNRHDLFSFEKAASLSGARFVILRKELVLLEQALIQWVLSLLVTRYHYHPLTVPELVYNHHIQSCGFQPRDTGDETQIYSIEQPSSLSLIGTSEIPLVAQYSSSVLSDRELPLRLCCPSHCFRTEAGGHGKSNKGLYRLHQFSKVELVSLCEPSDSAAIFDEIVDIQRTVLDTLGLHYRVINIASGDLGASAHRKYDMEAWMPGRTIDTATTTATDMNSDSGSGGGSYGEVSSASECLDYQSRRLNIKYKSQHSSSPAFVHTLNGTALAVPRIIIAILEQFQRADGSASVPACLQPYMMGIAAIPSPLFSVTNQ